MTERMPIKEAKKKFIKRSFYCGVVAILVCWFMKLFGFDYFGLDLDNKFFNDLDMFLDKFYLKHLFSLLILNIQLYLMCCAVNKEDGKPTLIYILKCLPLTIIARLITTHIGGNLSNMLEMIFVITILSKFKIKKILKSILVVFVSVLYQAISLNTRSLNLQSHSYTYVASMILTLDYTILLYLHKEMEVNIMGDTSWFFFGFTEWLYKVAGFIVGLFKFKPIKTARKWGEIGKAKEDAKRAKKQAK